MKEKKRIFRAVMLIFFFLAFIKLVLDRTTIIRISYDIEGRVVLTSDKLPIVYQGGGKDDAKICFCYRRVTEDGQLIVIDFNLFKPKDLAWGYYLNDAFYVDGKEVEYNFNFMCSKRKSYQFWNANTEVHLFYDDAGKLHSKVDCENSTKIEETERGDHFDCIIYK